MLARVGHHIVSCDYIKEVGIVVTPKCAKKGFYGQFGRTFRRLVPTKYRSKQITKPVVNITTHSTLNYADVSCENTASRPNSVGIVRERVQCSQFLHSESNTIRSGVKNAPSLLEGGSTKPNTNATKPGTDEGVLWKIHGWSDTSRRLALGASIVCLVR